MPWEQNNSNGGGKSPWGQPSNGSPSNGNSPWGQGGGQRHTAQSNDGDFIERVRRQGRGGNGGGMPGGLSGGGAGRLFIFGALVLGLGWLALNSIYQVELNEQAVVKRFGKLNRVEGPGLNFKLPAPLEVVTRVDVKGVRETAIGFSEARGRSSFSANSAVSESLMITGDQNIVDMKVNVQWRVASATDFLFNVQNPSETVLIAAESAVREIVGRTPIQDALSVGRERIQVEMQELLQNTLDQYRAGIVIEQMQLQDVQPPAQVKEAFDNVQRAQQERDRAANQAEAYRNSRIPKARGEADGLRNDALTYYQRETKNAEGEAQRFIELLSAYRQAPEITRQRMYLDTMKDIYGNGKTMVIDQDLGALPLLPLMQGNQARQP